MNKLEVDPRILTSRPLNLDMCPNTCEDESSACIFKPQCAATLGPVGINIRETARKILEESSAASNAMKTK